MSTELSVAKLQAVGNALALTDGWFSEIAKRCNVTFEVVRAMAYGPKFDLCGECVGTGKQEGRAERCKRCNGSGIR